MSETAELAEKLKSEGERMVAFFSALDNDQWQAEVYTEGTTWTIRNVLSHYVTSERGLVRLFEQIRQGGGGVTDEFSIDRYNASQQEKTRELPPAELLEQYKAVRAESITWVQGLKDEELEIQGRHPFLGQTVIREMVRMLYMHNQLHYRDVKRALSNR
ncbi:MAG: maleylpyruvate isomerase N-terminal domain-containing protein [Chloroflexi bacterium]|nr:maleylpyruvate isomerase N-terminal domain-containing protein [Chloroflexota bacterium]